MNILLTTAGRRDYMIEYFKKAIGNNGLVFAANSVMSSALMCADEFVITPMIYDKEYISFLINYCQEKSIQAIVPLFDMDVLVLAQHRKELTEKGIFVVVSNTDIVEMCIDKYLMYKYVKKIGCDSPATTIFENEVTKLISRGEYRFPIIVKPRYGMGSIGNYVANDMEELQFFGRKCCEDISCSYLMRMYKNEKVDLSEGVVFQQYIHGEEYGIDIVNDLNGVFKTAVVKKKLMMRSGETDSASIIEDLELNKLSKTMADNTKHVGNMDVDIIRANKKNYIIDMNPRFGGGYPFSYVSGVDLPRAIVMWLNNETPKEELFTVKKYCTMFKGIKIVSGE